MKLKFVKSAYMRLILNAAVAAAVVIYGVINLNKYPDGFMHWGAGICVITAGIALFLLFLGEDFFFHILPDPDNRGIDVLCRVLGMALCVFALVVVYFFSPHIMRPTVNDSTDTYISSANQVLGFLLAALLYRFARVNQLRFFMTLLPFINVGFMFYAAPMINTVQVKNWMLSTILIALLSALIAFIYVFVTAGYSLQDIKNALSRVSVYTGGDVDKGVVGAMRAVACKFLDMNTILGGAYIQFYTSVNIQCNGSTGYIEFVVDYQLGGLDKLSTQSDFDYVARQIPKIMQRKVDRVVKEAGNRLCDVALTKDYSVSARIGGCRN